MEGQPGESIEMQRNRGLDTLDDPFVIYNLNALIRDWTRFSIRPMHIWLVDVTWLCMVGPLMVELKLAGKIWNILVLIIAHGIRSAYSTRFTSPRKHIKICLLCDIVSTLCLEPHVIHRGAFSEIAMFFIHLNCLFTVAKLIPCIVTAFFLGVNLSTAQEILTMAVNGKLRIHALPMRSAKIAQDIIDCSEEALGIVSPRRLASVLKPCNRLGAGKIDDVCSLCHESMDTPATLAKEEFYCRLPCNHVFHYDCIVPWVTKKSGTCPLCRMRVYKPTRSQHAGKMTVISPRIDTNK